MDKALSNKLYLLKALAILGVITLHSNYQVASLPFISRILGNFSAVGVVIFLILSGYFFNGEQSGKAFWKKKILFLIVPWLIGGSIVYSLRLFTGDNFQIKQYINFLLGNGSYLYFATNLTICYILFRLTKGKSGFTYIFIGLTITSCLLTSFGVIPQKVLTEKWAYTYFTNPYLNLFNWIGFFGFGIVLKNLDLLHKFNLIKANIKAIILVVTLSMWIVLAVFTDSSYYWATFSLLNEILLLIILYSIISLSLKVDNVVTDALVFIGKNTLVIYLYHMPFITNVLSMNNDFINIIKPLVVLVIFGGLLLLVNKIIKNERIKKLFNIVFGIK